MLPLNHDGILLDVGHSYIWNDGFVWIVVGCNDNLDGTGSELLVLEIGDSQEQYRRFRAWCRVQVERIS